MNRVEQNVLKYFMHVEKMVKSMYWANVEGNEVDHREVGERK